MSYEKLHVQFSEHESTDYYINQVSCGFEKRNLRYWVKSFSGTYYFDVRTKEVTLDTGVEIKKRNDITFKVLC